MNTRTLDKSVRGLMKRGTMYHSKIKKGQTATEYLIILAVVIIISLVVVSVLGGIPSIGGSSSEQTARLQLAAAKVGITDYYISEAKGLFTFKNNQATTIRIDSVTVDDKKCFLIGSNSNPTLEPILRAGESQTVSCGSITAQSDESYTYAATINYTDTKTQAQFTLDDLEIRGTAPSFVCPDGFIPVPGGFILADGSTVDDFCVMKYEAKDVGGVATSQPELTPWVSINQTDAIAECQSLGSGYDLISDQQWMVLAENVLNTPINDLVDGTEGPQLGNGNSNGPNAFAAGADPVVSGCDLSQSLNTTANEFTSTCQLRGTNGNTADFGYTSDGASNFGIAYNSGADSRAKLRTHVLSNGAVVWDLAGNVYQWSGDVIATTPGSDGYYDSVTDYTGIAWMEPSQSRGSAYGFGYRGTYGSTSVVALRGGYWDNGGTAGVFTVSGSYAPSVAPTFIGFRCVHSPGG